MRIIYLVGNDGAGKTTLASIAAYNLFLRHYQVAVMDLTDRGKGYFFRFGACDFFALGEGGADIPRGLLVSLQDIAKPMEENPLDCLGLLPLMPGLKLILSAPDDLEKKMFLARRFTEIYQHTFDFLFVEMNRPVQTLRPVADTKDLFLLVCAQSKDSWPVVDPGMDGLRASHPEQVKVILNRQNNPIAAATTFLEKNKLGVDYLFSTAQGELNSTTVMELCKLFKDSKFLKEITPFIYDLISGGCI